MVTYLQTPCNCNLKDTGSLYKVIKCHIPTPGTNQFKLICQNMKKERSQCSTCKNCSLLAESATCKKVKHVLLESQKGNYDLTRCLNP